MHTTSPNLILIMADDLGYGDLGCFGSAAIATPNIDALAAAGVTFTDFHANGAVCTPTRAALLTGRYQQRSGLEGVIYVSGATRETGLDPARNRCLAHAFREAGYATALFGKWHLGYRPEYNPVRHGFDRFRGYVSGNVDYHSHVDNSGVADWWDNLDLIEEPGYVTDLVSSHAVDFVEANRDRPFFLYVAHEAPHFPYQGRNDPAERAVGGKPNRNFQALGARQDRQAAYKEMIEAMDDGVGRIVAKLRELDLDRDTLVVFCSDNGALAQVGSNGALRGEKGDLYEGGHRVPAAAAWPGRIRPGSVSGETVLSMDLLPTFLKLAGRDVGAAPLDGIDVSAALLEQGPLPPRDLFWRYHGKAAVRRGRWKLIRTDAGCELFDLADDPGERRDLAPAHPDLLADLLRAFERWEREVLAGVTLST